MVLNFIKSKACMFCEMVLPQHTPMLRLVCSSLACRQEWLQLEQKQRDRQKEERELLLVQQLEQLRIITSKEIACSEQDLQLLRTPYQGNSQESLSDVRRDKFSSHLQDLIDTIDQLNLDQKYRAPHRLVNPPPDKYLATTACGNCQGACCTQGYQTSAFIERETLLQSLEYFPELTLDEIKVRYLDCLPAASIKNSCAYHTDTGCVLDSKLRARICNDFYCRELRAMSGQSVHNNTLFVAIDEQKIQSKSAVSVREPSEDKGFSDDSLVEEVGLRRQLDL
jgi:hypothetical protein